MFLSLQLKFIKKKLQQDLNDIFNINHPKLNLRQTTHILKLVQL